MVVNPAGPVVIADGGTPRIITALNRIGVTGGQLVFLGGDTNVVSSGLNSFVSSDIVVSGLASGTSFNGIVITPGNSASGTNNYVSVGLAGMYILAAGSDVRAGKAVEVMAADAVRTLGSHIIAAAYDDGGASGGRKIGRALTAASSGTSNFAIIQLTP